MAPQQSFITPPCDDRKGRVRHLTRRGPTCRTEWRAGDGYYWAHISSDKWKGPFASREAAIADEVHFSSRKP